MPLKESIVYFEKVILFFLINNLGSVVNLDCITSTEELEKKDMEILCILS